MTPYLISMGAHSMDHILDEDMPAVAKTAHAVLWELSAAEQRLCCLQA